MNSKHTNEEHIDFKSISSGYLQLATILAMFVMSIILGTFVSAQYATAGENSSESRFIANNDGTVLDTTTNLMWASKDNGRDLQWSAAKNYCENYRGGGYTNWRMPTLDELSGLYDARITTKSKTEGFCRGGYHITDFIQLTCCCIWASDKREYEVSYFGFDYNNKRWESSLREFSISTRALPVRSIK